MKKAEMAVGTMILFIAMLIVTASTIAVFFQLSQKLQSTAQTTGERSTNEIITKLQILAITGINGSSGHLKNFLVEARLAPGSDTMKLNESIVLLQLPNKSVTLSFKNAPCTNVTPGGNGYSTNPSTSMGNFTVSYLVTGNNYTTGRIDSNDIIKICFASPIEIEASDAVGIRIMPSSGTPSFVNVQVPAVLVSAYTQLYP